MIKMCTPVIFSYKIKQIELMYDKCVEYTIIMQKKTKKMFSFIAKIQCYTVI